MKIKKAVADEIFANHDFVNSIGHPTLST